MPFYTYENPKTGETKDVFQSMNDKHEYAENGVGWKRQWSKPEGVASTKLDPFSQQQFMDKIASSKGSYGDVIDRSADLSAQRADKAGGIDPVRKKKYDEYTKKCHGKPHPHLVLENAKRMRDAILSI